MKGEVENMEKILKVRESKLLENEQKSKEHLQLLEQREKDIAQREIERLKELELKESGIKSLREELLVLEERQKQTLIEKEKQLNDQEKKLIEENKKKIRRSFISERTTPTRRNKIKKR